MHTIATHSKYHDDLLLRHLPELLGSIEPGAVEVLLQHLEWVEVQAGQALMTQGEAGDAMYLLVSGRLRTYISNEYGETRAVRDIARGQIVGEMSLFTDEPRSATVVAIRDSVLVRLGKDRFKHLLSVSEQASIALTRQIINRLRTEGSRSLTDRPAALGLIPISKGVDPAAMAAGLAEQLRSTWKVAVVDAASLDADLGEPGITERPESDVDASRRIAVRLDEIESAHDFLLLVSDGSPTPWTYRCCRHCDELLLMADADQPPRLHTIEEECLMSRPPRTDATGILVLLHPDGRLSPRGTREWLARRPLDNHLHIRPALQRDMARLARMVSRTGVGLVLAGGGARGLAHIGIYRALRERGIEVDVVGGTSIGSVIATAVATDQPLETVTETARRAFSSNPTNDFNLIPAISLFKGRRLRRIVEKSLQVLTGPDTQVEDLWKSFYCVATNYSQAREEVLRRGSLMKALLASIAIPGAVPPVIHDGDLLCDGGTFNNFPVDVMRKHWGVGQVIGADLSFSKPRRIEHEEVPGNWALLRDRLRPRGKRRFRMPSLAAYLMNITVLYSTSRKLESRKMIDLYFNPPLSRVGMLAWHRFDDIVQQGYAHACEVLDARRAAS